MHRIKRQTVFSLATGCALLIPAIASGQTDSSGISVSGRGKVKGAPTIVELSGTISAEAELTGDALTKFRSTREKALAAIVKLGLPNLTMQTNGFGIGPTLQGDSATQLMLSRARGATPEPPKVLVQESIRIRLGGIDKLDREKLLDAMAKIVDTGKESGVTFGPPAGSMRSSLTRDEFIGFAIFSIDNIQPLREQSENLALQDARAKAERLSKFNGGRLGEIRSIHESASSVAISSLRATPPDQSFKLEEIEISTMLQVQFHWSRP